jgi:hypothetical protein
MAILRQNASLVEKRLDVSWERGNFMEHMESEEQPTKWFKRTLTSGLPVPTLCTVITLYKLL